jgi:flagellar hook-length control protein FliK
MSQILASITTPHQGNGNAVPGGASGAPVMGVAAFLHMLDLAIAGNAASREGHGTGEQAPGQEHPAGMMSALATEARLQRIPVEAEPEEALPSDAEGGVFDDHAEDSEIIAAAPSGDAETLEHETPVTDDEQPEEARHVEASPAAPGQPESGNAHSALLSQAAPADGDAASPRQQVQTESLPIAQKSADRVAAGERPEPPSRRAEAVLQGDGDETRNERSSGRNQDGQADRRLEPLSVRPDRPGSAERPVPAPPEMISTALSTIQEAGADDGGRQRLVMPVSHAPMSYGGDASPTGASSTRAAIPAVALEIATQARNGARHFEIRLDPPELGRIEVRLDFARDGNMTTKLIVERPETLDLLMRDARALEKTLQSSGMKLEDGSVQYHLRDQSAFGRDSSPEHGGKPRLQPDETSENEGDAESHMEPVHRRLVSLNGVDMRV